MKEFIKNRKDQKMAVLVRIPEKSKDLAFTMHGLSGFKGELHTKIIADVFFARFRSIILKTEVFTFPK